MTPRDRYGLGALGLACFLIAWEAAGRGLGDALLAPPTEVVPVVVDDLVHGGVLATLGDSLRQMLAGYALAFVVAVPVGVLMGRSRVADALLHPWVSMFLVTSVAAIVPLVVLLFGYGFEFRVVVVFLASLWYMLLTVYQGARGVDPRYLAVARSFVANPVQVFAKVLLPVLVPYVLVAARIGLVHAIRAMVIAELFISHGFGRLLFLSGLEVSTASGLSLLLILMLASLLANQVLHLLSMRLCPWYAPHARAGRP